MYNLIRSAFLTLLLASSIAYGQSFVQSLTVEGPFVLSAYQPLTTPQRWHRWVEEDGLSPAIHVNSLSTAAYMQIRNYPAEWKGTTNGYLRRAGSSYASKFIQNSVHDGMAGIAGTDPRYFACACSGFFHRSGHALKMTFFTYNRNGHLTLDVPQLAGAYGSSMIEVMWYPQKYSPLVQGVQSGHVEVGIIGAEHILQEFSPELKRFFHLRFLMSDQ